MRNREVSNGVRFVEAAVRTPHNHAAGFALSAGW